MSQAPEEKEAPKPEEAQPAAAAAEPESAGEAAVASEAAAEQRRPRGGRGGREERRPRGRRDSREPRDRRDSAAETFESVVKVYRSAAVVKGGRRFSFAALTVVGDRAGRVGIGYGKANAVPNAVEKSFKHARRSMKKVVLAGHTLPHEVVGRYLASRVFMRPAAPGTGIIAGAAVRAVAEAAGVTDLLTKSYGSNSAKNLVKATMQGLLSLRDRATVERLRGVELE